MSGVKNKAFAYRKRFYALSIVYFLGMGFILYVVMQIPKIYTSETVNHNKKAEEQVLSIMKTKEVSKWESSFQKMVDDGKVDVVVLSKENTIYQSKPSINFEKLHDYINEKQVNVEKTFQITIDGTDYQVWLAIYPINPVDIFSLLLGLIGAGVVGLCLITLLLFQVAFKRLVKPMYALKEKIVRLKNYHLSQDEKEIPLSEYDMLSNELDEFARDLQGKLSTINTKYTDLEYELEAVVEEEIMKKRLVGSLIHSLKSPLNITLIEGEELKKQVAIDIVQNTMDNIIHSNDRVLHNINEILKILNSDEKRSHMDKEHINLVPIVKETIQLFKPMFNNRKIIFSLDAPRELIMYMNPIIWKQIVHNIISNASSYTDDEGEFEFVIYEENNYVYIEAYNDKKECDKIEFDRVFDIFYHIESAEHKYSSGVGLYTVKSMVENYNGECKFKKKGNGVELSIRFPKEEHQNEKE